MWMSRRATSGRCSMASATASSARGALAADDATAGRTRPASGGASGRGRRPSRPEGCVVTSVTVTTRGPAPGRPTSPAHRTGQAAGALAHAGQAVARSRTQPPHVEAATVVTHDEAASRRRRLERRRGRSPRSPCRSGVADSLPGDAGERVPLVLVGLHRVVEVDHDAAAVPLGHVAGRAVQGDSRGARRCPAPARRPRLGPRRAPGRRRRGSIAGGAALDVGGTARAPRTGCSSAPARPRRAARGQPAPVLHDREVGLRRPSSCWISRAAPDRRRQA